MPNHPALAAGRPAVITGGASGIGLACARKLAGLGMHLVLADLPGERLERAAEALREETNVQVLAVPTDVGRLDQVERLRDRAVDAFGDVAVLMNNAGVGAAPGKPWENLADWKRVIAANLWGVVHGVHAFAPWLLARPEPSAIINTGSKQGITNPPGTAAYNVSKAGVRILTEQLAYALSKEAPQVSAHLLIPGWVHTPIMGDRPRHPDAWLPEEVADFMVSSLERGDFYILCPDNAVPRPLDEARLHWSIHDISLNRPALSRWRPGFKDSHEGFVQRYLGWRARKGGELPEF